MLSSSEQKWKVSKTGNEKAIYIYNYNIYIYICTNSSRKCPSKKVTWKATSPSQNWSAAARKFTMEWQTKRHVGSWNSSHVCSGLEALPHFGVKQIQLIYAQKWDMSALLFRTGSICCVVVFCCFVLIHRTKWCSFAGHAKIFLEQTWRYLMISHLEVKYIIWWFQTWTLFSIAYGLLSFPLTNSYVSRWLFHQQPVILW